jgi:hypothetical protein
MRRIQKDFKLKDDKIAPPDVCLGATIEKMTTPNGKSCWSMSPEQCVKAAVANVEEELARHGKRLPPKCVTPFFELTHPMVGRHTGAESGWRATVPRTHWPAKVGC